jgi:WD40 repeat protein
VARRKTIYVSSTYTDLADHRAVLKTELERAGYDVESMERYAAFPEPPLERCLADVASCDGYVLLLAHRYGFVPTTDGKSSKSITELEYEQAVRCGKPPFVFCIDQHHPWPPQFVDTGKAAEQVSAFRKRVEESHGRRTFTEPNHLTMQVLAALSSDAWRAVTDTVTSTRRRYAWPKPWDFSAYMADKREGFEGRDWFFEEIKAWLAADHPKALLLRADFGVGKSAMVSELVRRNPGGAIVASHFCLHDTRATLHPGIFVRNLAAQLAVALPAYRELVEADVAVQEWLDGALADPGTALEAAILGPLSRLAPPGPRVVLIDALDEALELDTTPAPASAHRGTTLLSLLSGKAPRFPPWLRLLATTRPNPRVQGQLLHAFGLKEIDAGSDTNQDDLRRYILRRAHREPIASRLRNGARSAVWLVDTLASHTQGKFLYAVRAMRDLELGHMGLDDLAALPPGMDSFYFDAFDRRFLRAGQNYGVARRLLGLLAAAREPLAPALAAAVLETGEDEVKAVHRTLPDFLRLRNKGLIFDHFSIAEWLTRESDEGFARAGEYAVDLAASQSALRRWALQQVERGVAHRSPYLVRHLAAHLESEDERQRICGTLLLEHFEWLQARLDQEGLDAMVLDIQALAPTPDQGLLLAVLRNSANVLRQAPEQLAGHLLGRVGIGLGRNLTIAALARSTWRWLGGEEQRARIQTLLVPQSRSMRLSVAHEVTLVGGGAALALFPDGRIVSGGEDGAVLLWDLARPHDPIRFGGVTASAVNRVAVLPDGRIAAASCDGAIRLWDPTRPTEPVVFVGHTDLIRTLAVLPDGRIVSGSDDQTVRLWDPARPDEPIVFQSSRFYQALALLPGGRIAWNSPDYSIRLWSATRPDDLIKFDGHGDVVFAGLPDGRIASGEGRGDVRLWDPTRPDDPIVFKGHTDFVRALAVLPGGRVASGSYDHTVRLWDPACPTKAVIFSGHSDTVTRLAVLPDGRIASGSDDQTVRLWDPTRPLEATVFEGHSDSVGDLAVLPDGRIVSASYDRSVRVWDPGRPAEHYPYLGHKSYVSKLAVLPDGRVASASPDQTVRLWDPADLANPMVFEGHLSGVYGLAALPDGRIASGSIDDVRVWDPEHPGNPVIFEHDSGRILAVLPEGRIALAGYGAAVRLLDPARPKTAIVLRGHTQTVTALAVLPDGRIASGSDDSTVRIWDPARPHDPILFKAHTTSIRGLAVLPDGRIVSGSQDGTVRLWNPRYPAESIVFEGHTNSITELVVMPDGRIATGSGDGAVTLWHPARPTEPVIFKGHTDFVVELAPLPDGRLASGAQDGTVRVWDPTKGGLPQIFAADAAIMCVAAVSPRLIVAGCADGAVHFLCPAASE